MAEVGSLLNIVIFFAITILFYTTLKPKATLDNVNLPEYTSKNRMATLIYFGLVLLFQFAFNSYVLSKACGQSGTSRYIMGQAALYTLVPWTFFFGIIILVLYVFPSFKSAFSDIVGYYFVSSSANDILVTLLKNQGSPEITARVFSNTEGSGVDESLSDKPNFFSKNPDFSIGIEGKLLDFGAPAESNRFDTNLQRKLDKIIPSLEETEASGVSEVSDEKANDLIMKICGNASVLINQMLPSNFDNYWNTLQPLFKPSYRGAGGNELKEKLFNLVVTRDNVGESMWYIYTGILVSSIVQFQIASSNCKAASK